MAATTFLQGWIKQSDAMKTLDILYKAFGINATNFVDAVQTYQLAVQSEGREAAQGLGAFLSVRSALVNTIQRPTDRFNPQLAVIARSPQVDSARTDVVGQLADTYRYMALNSFTITSRGLVRGPWATTGFPVGNGTFKQVWIDGYGWPLEAAWPEARVFTCTKDQNLGAQFKGREEFLIEGAPFTDELEWTVSGRGSGLNQFTNVVNADDSLLSNPNFSATPSGGDATPNGTATWNGTTYGNVAGWLVVGGLVGDGTDMLIDRTNYYQEAKLDNGSPAALKVKTSKTIFQPLKGRLSNNIAIDDSRPQYFGIKVKADLVGQWTGTIVLTVGSKSWTKTVTVETGWIDVGPDANDATFTQTDLWYLNWGANASGNNAKFQVAITKTSGATTVLLVTRTMFVNYNPVICPRTGGVMDFVLGLSGSTPFMKWDAGSQTTTEVGGAICQAWSHRGWGFSWPSRPAATVTAPTAALSGTAGVVTAGGHVVAYAPVSTDGIEGPISSVSGNVAADGTHKIDVSGIPAKPANVASWKIYMSKAGVPATLYDTGVTTTGTTAAINTADAALIVQPKTITIAEP